MARTDSIDSPPALAFARFATAVLLISSIVGSACSSDDGSLTPQSPTSVEQLELLTLREVQKTAIDSPQRTVLRWWRYAQYRNARESLRQFVASERERLREADYAALLFRDFGPWAVRARPRVQGVEIQGVRAVVFTDVAIREPVGPSLHRVSHEYLAFSLERSSGRWLIADSTFFQEKCAEVRRARLDSEREENES